MSRLLRQGRDTVQAILSAAFARDRKKRTLSGNEAYMVVLRELNNAVAHPGAAARRKHSGVWGGSASGRRLGLVRSLSSSLDTPSFLAGIQVVARAPGTCLSNTSRSLIYWCWFSPRCDLTGTRGLHAD
jgi:hypothetical protein